MSESLLDAWRARFAAPTAGWDFSALEPDLHSDEPPWSYDLVARANLAGARSALDLGTGGGEVLLRLAEALPRDMVATEGWKPNLPIAASALASAAIPVVAYDAEVDPVLPFPDGRFEVVLSRHEAYDVREVARVLSGGGRFVTQQVDGRSFAETGALFRGGSRYPHVTLARFRADAEAAGLIVRAARDWRGSVRFRDVGTLLSYLRMVPWEVPEDFTVDRYADQLLALQATDGPIVFGQRRFLLVCAKGD